MKYFLSGRNIGLSMTRCVAVLGADSGPLTDIIALYRLRWLGQVFRMAAHCLSFRVLFARAEQGQKKRRGDQVMIWPRGMKN